MFCELQSLETSISSFSLSQASSSPACSMNDSSDCRLRRRCCDECCTTNHLYLLSQHHATRNHSNSHISTTNQTAIWLSGHHKSNSYTAIWPTTSVWPAAVILVHCQPPAWCWTSLAQRRHWETEHLPSPDRVSGTAFLLPSVIRHCRCQSPESCWKLICLFKGRGAGDLWTGALEMYWLTN